MKVLFVRIGLAVLLIVYLVGGAAVFRALEAPNEHSKHQKAVKDLEEVLWNVSCTDLSDIRHLLSLAQELRGASLNIKNGTLQVSPSPSVWNHGGAIFFAMTVLTTIGYGSIVPSTAGGRIFCVFYALGGIPLFLSLLAAIGKHIAKSNSRITHRMWGLKPGSYQKHVVQLLLLGGFGTVLLMLLPSVVFMYVEGWTYGEALYYTFITLSTIGFGDYVAGTFSSTLLKVVFAAWIPVGLSWFASLISTVQDIITEKVANDSSESEDDDSKTKDSINKVKEEPVHELPAVRNARVEPDSKLKSAGAPTIYGSELDDSVTSLHL